MGAADFKVIEHTSFALTGTGSKNIPFKLEDDVSGSRSVLAFRVKTDGSKLKLKFEIVGHTPPVFEQEFEASERSWHDVVQAGFLAKDNTLKVTKLAGAGKITVSNIVLYYQRG
jgi:hypothetical protein